VMRNAPTFAKTIALTAGVIGPGPMTTCGPLGPEG
jgi:hypothetical protein